MLWMLLSGLAALPALAQPPSPLLAARGPEILRSQLLAERNQLGLMEHCRSQGYADAQAVEAQRRVVAALNAADTGTMEEAAGRAGTIAFATPQASFADDAKAKGITVQFNCEQLARRVMGAAR